MIQSIIEKLRDKKIAILGFGREGKATYDFIKKYLPNANITIIDKDEELVQKNSFLENEKTVTGISYLSNLEDYDLIIKTPGISLKNIDITNIKDKITSELELLLEVNSNNVIGITGTKGKSTTTSLVYQIIKEQNDNTVLVGNIGIPIFSMLEECNNETIFVTEMSSHQLEFIKVSPHIGVVLNLFEEHLDHAGTLEHYHDIKLNMFRYQLDLDYMIYCSNNEALNNLVSKNSFYSTKYSVNPDNDATTTIKNNMVVYNNEELYNINSKRNLIGKHNLENIMVALTISKILNLDIEKAVNTINNFKGLEFRLENIGTINDVTYYTDTLATIPEATIEAIEALKDVDTLIFGGMDRGISYNEFITYLNKTNINNFICMPTTGHDIGKKLNQDKVKYVENLEDAVELAKELTAKGKICLLSPAAASYGFFKNYEDKGNKYKELVYKNN